MNEYDIIRFKYDRPTKQKSTSDYLEKFAKINFLLVDKDVVPEIYKLIEAVKRDLNLKLKVTAFIVPSSEIQAFCETGHDEIRIFIHSATIEQFTNNELKFIIGHEIGHCIFNHYIKNKKPPMTTNDMIRLQCREISADRVGFLASSDISIVGRTIIKLISGLSSKHITNNFIPILRQSKNLKNLDFLFTHPALSLRLQSIIEFSMSKEFNFVKKGKNHGSFDLNEVDEHIYKKMKEHVSEDVNKEIYKRLEKI